MKIAVTGSTGFIGSYVVKELSSKGYSVRALARDINKVPALMELKNVEFVSFSLSEPQEFSAVLNGSDVLIHIAVGFKPDELDIMAQDTLPAIQLFSAAIQAGVQKIIFTSSTSVMDYLYATEKGKYDYEGAIIDEGHNIMPVTPYGASKASIEAFLQSFSQSNNLMTTIIRPGYIFGNPVVIGGSIQPDSRFKNLVDDLIANRHIALSQNHHILTGNRNFCCRQTTNLGYHDHRRHNGGQIFYHSQKF